MMPCNCVSYLPYHTWKSVNDILGGHGQRQPWSSLMQQPINFVDKQCETKNNFPIAGLTSKHGARALFHMNSHSDTITFIFHILKWLYKISYMKTPFILWMNIFHSRKVKDKYTFEGSPPHIKITFPLSPTTNLYYKLICIYS